LKKGIIRIVEPSDNLKNSYFEMSDKFFKSANLLLENKFYESSTGDFYYSLYNSLLGVLFFCGIKSENHNASINLLKDFFEEKKLFKIIMEVKEERIDKQYYHKTPSTSKRLLEIKVLCQEFNLGIRILLKDLNKEKINFIRLELKQGRVI